MGQVKFTLEADEAKAVRALLRVVDAQKKTEDGARKITAAGKEMAKEYESAGAKAGKEFAAMAAGAVSVAAAIGGIKSALAAVRADAATTRTAITDLVETTKEFDRAGLKLANQMGQAASTSGQALGREQLTELMRAGRFGSDVERGKSVGIAAHVAFGTPGAPLSGSALEIAKLAAAFTGYKQIGADETGGLIKLMAQAGAQNYGDVAQRLSQFGSAYEKSLSVDESASIGGLTRFMAGHIAQGGSYARGLAEFTQAVKVSGSEQEAATLVRKTTDMIRRTPAMIAIGREAWPDMAAAGGGGLAGRFGSGAKAAAAAADAAIADRFAALPLEERKKMFGDYVSRHAGDESTLMELGLESRQTGWALSLYGRGGLTAIDAAEKVYAGVGGEQLPGQLAAFGETPMARLMAGETEHFLAAQQTGYATKIGEQAWRDAERRRQLQRSGAEPNPQAWTSWFTADWREVERETYGNLRSRFNALPGGSFRRQYAGELRAADRALGEIDPAGGVPFMPAADKTEIGQATLLVEKLEKLAAALEKNTAATQTNTSQTGHGPGGATLNIEAQTE